MRIDSCYRTGNASVLRSNSSLKIHPANHIIHVCYDIAGKSVQQRVTGPDRTIGIESGLNLHQHLVHAGIGGHVREEYQRQSAGEQASPS